MPSTPNRWALWKQTILAPQTWGAHQRNDFSKPRPLQLPIGKKLLSSLAWAIWFSVISCNLFRTTPVYPSSPLTTQSSFLRVTWDATSQAQVLSFVHRIKHSSQLLYCTFFFQLTVAYSKSVCVSGHTYIIQGRFYITYKRRVICGENEK